MIKLPILKNLWLNLVEAYINLGFLFYYKKIKTIYIEEIPKDKAVIFLSNHQNALLDPLLIAVNSTRKNYFLTRADVFTNKVITSILKSLQMIPVYRLRDGIRTITKNKRIFSYCSDVLLNNKSIILFPEGNHSLNRNVRNLSKGFTRIIEDYLKRKKEHKLVIIPVGLNYQTPTEFGDRVSIFFGRSIDPSKFLNSNNELDILLLKSSVQNNLKELTAHIETDDNYNDIIHRLNSMKVDFTDPVNVNECINNDFEYEGKKVKDTSKTYYLFKFLTILIYSVPYLIWKTVITPKIIQNEFIGTLRFMVIITIAPIFLIVEVLLFSFFIDYIYGLILMIAGIIIPLITSKIK